MKRILLMLLAAGFITSVLSGQEVNPASAVPRQWITSWLLCGPFPVTGQPDPADSWNHLAGFSTDFLKKSGGEQDLKAKPGDVVAFQGGTAVWRSYQSPDSIINLDKAVSEANTAMAYAYTEILSDKDMIWMIALGSNDGGRLWVNGANVWDNPESRGLKVDDDLIPVLLKKGRNTILLKIEEKGNRWEFCMRLLTYSVNDLSGDRKLFRIRTGEDGKAEITSPYAPDVLKALIESADFEVLDNEMTTVFRRRQTASFGGKVELGKRSFQPYKARIAVRLKSGESLSDEISFEAGERITYTLFAGRSSDYSIVIDRDASESERWATLELQNWLERIGGVKLPVIDIDKKTDSPRIIIGYNRLVKELTGVVEPPESDESFHYLNVGADILIYGGKLRGSMYGVMSFLENELGCRWYTPSVSVIPARSNYSFAWLNCTGQPGIRVRNDFYYEAFDPVWAARNKMNGAMSTRQQPGGVESYWSVHTFYPLMPPSEFFSSHPEYYSLIDGKRTYDRAQLCLSNPEVLSIITERIRKRMRESPEYLIYDVSQNDWYNPCQCDKCQAIAGKYGGESGVIVWFVNQVAEAVEKEFPGKFIGTLAYQYSRTPPKGISPRNNVVVRLCSIECCFAHDFKSCPENRAFLSDLRNWAALAPHLYIWDYVVNFSHYVMPYPNFAVLKPNIQTFRENNAIGIMEQAAYQGRGGEFSELRAYLISKLLWNPDCDAGEVIDDFMYGYYGRAGNFVKKYFDLLNSRVKPDSHIHLGLSPDDQIFSDEFVSESLRLFSLAAGVADSQEILRRVEMASLPVLYLKCRRSPVQAKYDGTYARFCEIAKREGVTFYAESGEPHRISFHKTVESAK